MISNFDSAVAYSPRQRGKPRATMRGLCEQLGLPASVWDHPRFWSHHAGLLDELYYDCQQQYLAEIKRLHALGEHEGKEATELNAIWNEIKQRIHERKNPPTETERRARNNEFYRELKVRTAKKPGRKPSVTTGPKKKRNQSAPSSVRGRIHALCLNGALTFRELKHALPDVDPTVISNSITRSRAAKHLIEIPARYIAVEE